jgi:lipopolysaccharide export system permease protein
VTILHRYLLRSALRSSLLAAVFLGFTLVSLRLLRFGRLIGQPGVGLTEVSRLFVLLVPTFLELIIPLAVYIGVASTLVRLRQDGEITAVYAAGARPTVFVRPILLFATFVAAAAFFSAAFVRPAALSSLRTYAGRLATTSPATLIQANVFLAPAPGIVLYVNRVDDGGSIHGILLSDNRSRERRQVAIAAKGTLLANEQASAPMLRLEDGTIHSIDLRDQHVETTEFAELDWRLPIDEESLQSQSRTPAELSLLELLHAPAGPTSTPSPTALQLELFRRFALPFSCIIFALAGLSPLRSKRRSSYGEVAWIGGAAAILYYLSSTLAEALTVQEVISPQFGAVLPTVAIGAFVAASLSLYPTRLPRIAQSS